MNTANITNQLSFANSVENTFTERFDPTILKNGNDEDKNAELFKWAHNNGSSIFVQWVPNEFLPYPEAEYSANQPANLVFSNFGLIDRVEFVPKFTSERVQRGHMAFIHYQSWNPASTLQHEIAQSYPNPIELNWHYTDQYGNVKTYKLRCCINMTPIRKVEYNNSQLTDMFERLNTRVVEQMRTMQTTIDYLVEQNNALRNEMEIMKLSQGSK